MCFFIQLQTRNCRRCFKSVAIPQRLESQQIHHLGWTENIHCDSGIIDILDDFVAGRARKLDLSVFLSGIEVAKLAAIPY